jgi:serine/threonine protein kinase
MATSVAYSVPEPWTASATSGLSDRGSIAGGPQLLSVSKLARRSHYHLQTPMFQCGDVIDGQYALDRLVAIGEMATVFRADHLSLGRPVALKVLASKFFDNATVVAQFFQEGRATAQLRGPHSVEVLDAGTAAGGLPYLVMEWLEGSDLSEVLASGRLGVATAVDYVLQACEALTEAHAYGIVHRDLKPSNLFVTTGSDGQPLVKLLDFGISKVGGQATPDDRSLGIVGTPAYMSPEQIIDSDATDPRTDVWGLGVVLFELLTGQLPFEGEDLTEILASIFLERRQSCSRLREGLPRGLDNVISKCLATDLHKRFQSVTRLADALAFLASSPVRAYAPAAITTGHRRRKAVRRAVMLVCAVAAFSMGTGNLTKLTSRSRIALDSIVRVASVSSLRRVVTALALAPKGQPGSPVRPSESTAPANLAARHE